MSLHSLAPPGGQQSLRTRYTNCLDPGNNIGKLIRNVSLPFNDVNESERTVCTAALMCLEHVSYPSGMPGVVTVGVAEKDGAIVRPTFILSVQRFLRRHNINYFVF